MFRVKARKTRFVLISIQRSGTTMLSEYLNSHPDIYMAKELFKVTGEGQNVDPDGYRNSSLHISEFLDDFYTRRLEGKKVCGFKLMLDQIDQFREIQEYLVRNKIACIYMERLNFLKIFISRISARTSNLYHSDLNSIAAPVILDVETVRNDLVEINNQIQRARKIIKELRSHTIIYEDLVKNTPVQLRKIQKYLHVTEQNNLTAKFKKINSDNLNYSIGNYPEIFSKLADDKKYSKYLEPVKSFIHPYTASNEQYKCVFIHVPKVAGSSMESALFGTRGKIGHHYAIKYRDADGELYNDYYTFGFVRNPYDRVVSAYLYLKDGGRNKYDRDWGEKILSRYESFNDFIMALSDDSVRQIILNWIHFKPQYKYLCDEDHKIIVDFVGKYENLEEDFQKIILKLGVDKFLPHENVSERRHYDNYFDEQSRSVVSEVYRSDFEIFGYSRQW